LASSAVFWQRDIGDITTARDFIALSGIPETARKHYRSIARLASVTTNEGNRNEPPRRIGGGRGGFFP